MEAMKIRDVQGVDATEKYPARLKVLEADAFAGAAQPGRGKSPEESVMSLLIASCFAGGVKGENFENEARRKLSEGSDEELRRSAWSQIVPCLRTHEWLALIEDEGLSWARAAEVLRAIELDFGWLTGPVNEHAEECAGTGRARDGEVPTRAVNIQPDANA